MDSCIGGLNKSLKESDNEIFNLIQLEYNRQKNGLELIASENFTSQSVLECLGSCLTNKYSEGQPLKRYYGGNKYIDQVEMLCQKRALEAFSLNENEWGVNVQPLSGSPANFAVYTALLQPHERIMGMSLSDGGHLSHGHMIKSKKISATSVFWESIPYSIDPKTGLIDYDKLLELAKIVLPKIIIAGYSCYPRDLDYSRFRSIADSVGAILMVDMAHFAGLVASKLLSNPFEYADVVTTTTHKTLRGPRSGMIFYRKTPTKNCTDLEIRINSAVFPGLQGGPHNNTIAAVATALRQVNTAEFVEYSKRVLLNADAMANRFRELGYCLATQGTDNHLCLVDLRSLQINGSVAQRVLEVVEISVNKNAFPGDTNMLNPSGMRLGSPALTTRGFTCDAMRWVVDIIHETLSYASELVKSMDKFTLIGFEDILKTPNVEKRLGIIRESVIALSSQYPFPINF